MTCPFDYGTRHMWPCEEYRLPFDDNTELDEEEEQEELLIIVELEDETGGGVQCQPDEA